MKKLLSSLVIIALLVGLLGAIPVSAAGTVNVWVGSTNVIINDSVTVTIIYNGGGEGIGSLDAKFSYNTEIFEYLSCTGATANGGAGVVTISYYSMEATPSDELTITLKLKAVKPGDGNFKLTTAELCSDENTLLANHVKTIDITASEPSLSENASLKSLVPSRGTLTPKFSPDVTEYTISVSNSVESLSLSATTEDADAKTTISGKNALTVGKNTRVVTVTAPNGNTKKYTVVITRAAAPTTTAGSGSSTTPTVTTPTLPVEDTLEVSVDGKKMTVLDTQASVDLPDGFAWSNLTINRVEVPAAVSKTTGMTLLYLVGEDKADEGFYIYDTDADLLTRYRPLDTTVNHYLIYNPPADRPAPAGTTLGKMPYTNHYVGAYVYEDAALKDFYILWAAPMGGEADWYTYDKKEGTLQRYHATPGSGEQVVLPTNTQKPATTQKAKDTDSEKKFSFGSLFSEYANVIFFVLIGLGGLLVLGLVVILLIAAGKRNRGKH